MNDKKEINILVAGGINVGKTSVCLGLARKNVYIASSASSKIRVNTEDFTYKGVRYNLFDTPGFNNLLNTSEDELKTKESLLNQRCNMIMHVANARHIMRSLITAVQLIEFDMPFILALNMMDEAEKFGNNINIQKLAKLLDVGVSPTIANEGAGIDNLRRSLINAKRSSLMVRYNPIIEKSLDKVKGILAPDIHFSRGLGILVLINDSFTIDWLRKNLDDKRFQDIMNVIASITGDVSLMVISTKTHFVKKLLAEVVHKDEIKKRPALELIGNLSTHKVYGILILGIVLTFLYLFVGKLGAELLVNFFDGTVFTNMLNPMFARALSFIPSSFVRDAFVGEYGMLTMGLRTALAILLPIIVAFYFAFSFLEDFGYMPRLSVLLNNMFRRIGLNGRAILPIILGFSCVTMATVSTRVLEERKERLITILILVLVIPCSAKLAVIVAILAPVSLIGIFIIVAVLLILMFISGFISSKIIPGASSDFIMEIFPLRIPSMKAVLFKTYRNSMFLLKEALPFFIYGSFCLFLLDKMGVLPFLDALFSPVVVDMLQLPPKFTEAYILSFFRGEAGIIILLDMAFNGQLSNIQIVVSVIVIIVSIPCMTNLLMIIKEYGLKFGLFLVMLIMPLSLLIGVLVNYVIRLLPFAL